jgi:hypothetical protein
MTTTNALDDDGFMPMRISLAASRWMAVTIIDEEHPHGDDKVRVAAMMLLEEIDRLRALVGRNGIADGYEAGPPLATFLVRPVRR